MTKLPNRNTLKPYKVRELVFSCLRSKVAYEPPHALTAIFKTNMLNRDSVDLLANEIHNVPICYDGSKTKSKKDAHAFMLWKHNTIYVSFRGTKDINDIGYIINVKPKQIYKDAAVHTGFADQFMSLEEDISKDIRHIISEYPITQIVFTGHSMGGAIATIASAMYSSMLQNINITCHTFGSPTVGSDSFCAWFERGVDESACIQIQEDIIPKLPVNKDFKHVSGGIILTPDGNAESVQGTPCKTIVDLLQEIMNKDDYINLTKYHSCEMYIERLLSLKLS